MNGPDASGPDEPILSLRGLSVAYGPSLAVQDVTLDVRGGEFIAIIGPNGAGKSTLLKAILGLIPSQGGLNFAARLAPRPRTAIAYVPQQQTLDWTFPVTVLDVVLMGRFGRLGWLRRPGPADRKIARAALSSLGLSALAARPVANLSGGEKQRVLLARMLARGGDLLLLDEPLTGVDAATRERALQTLEHERAAGKALLMVTHDLDAAARWCSRLVLLNRRVVADGPPEAVYTPENVNETFSSSFLSHAHQSA
ncbi:MAG TPA: metal ABC transporter ATP-binding protein [Deinococcales bacterium]|nr:metal ABC transporter ATP-binding protein [Deinococcales bacterium]